MRKRNSFPWDWLSHLYNSLKLKLSGQYGNWGRITSIPVSLPTTPSSVLCWSDSPPPSLSHPLPLLNISDHYTRQSLNHNNPSIRVVGGLLGTQQGRQIDIINSFELALLDSSSSDDSTLNLDHTYFTTRRDQFRQVFPTFDFLGWYTIGDSPIPSEISLHKQFLTYNESPLFLQLSPQRPSSQTGKDLPLAIYETVLEPRENGEPEPVFVKVEYEIETGEAEKVAVDEVSQVQDDTNKPGASSSSTARALSSLFPSFESLT